MAARRVKPVAEATEITKPSLPQPYARVTDIITTRTFVPGTG